MGGTFGKSDNVPQPDFDIVGKGSSYEVRAYNPYVVAEVVVLNKQGGGTGDDDGSQDDDRFKTLAKVKQEKTRD